MTMMESMFEERMIEKSGDDVDARARVRTKVLFIVRVWRQEPCVVVDALEMKSA
jgi:hypothetical protein